MGKIRVDDLAQMMGIANQDLIFKLRSIGVRVDEEHVHIDTDVLKEILKGNKKAATPREVILRDQETEQPAPTVRRPPPAARRLPPVRPARRRVLIQTVEPRIKTIPTSERAAPAAPPSVSSPQAPPPVAEEPMVTSPAAAPPPPVPTPPPPATPSAGRTAAAPTGVKPRPTPPASEERRTARPAVTPIKQAEAEDVEADKEKEKKKLKRPRKVRDEAAEADLRILRGSLQEIEEAAEEAERVDVPVGGRRKRRAQRKQQEAEEGGKLLTFKKAPPKGAVTITEGMTVRDFAEKLGVKSKDLIQALFQRGVVANINHILDPETAASLAAGMGVEVKHVSFEEEIQLHQGLAANQAGETPPGSAARAPVVTIMGHVDHGKTTLLDAIRSSRVTESEFGGITQHIGAYAVNVSGRKIVFLDTPGHEAFTMMRARGAKATDIVVLVVAADDGVMPQTKEAIDHARAAGVPLVVAINKIDKPNANPDRVKKELADQGLTVEEWGGETVAVTISAKNKQGIGDLLELILLTADLLELKASPEIQAQGLVLEARKEAGRGIIATVLVQNGSMTVGDVFVAGATWGRVRSMTDDRGQRLTVAEPATPVEVAGFSELPAAGDPFQVVEEESKARSIAEFRQLERRKRDLAPSAAKLSLEDFFSRVGGEDEVKELPVIIKGDVQGSVEVLNDTLTKLSTERVKVLVIHSGVGAVTTNDVLLASASKAIVLGFNVRPERNAAELAESEQVEIRLHTVIYEVADELRKAMTGLLEPTVREVTMGRAEVRQIFAVPKAGPVAGCHVLEGVIARSAAVRLLRDNRVIHEGKISSLRRFKDDASEVRAGFDCGIRLERYQDVKPGDIIEAFVREEVAATL